MPRALRSVNKPAIGLSLDLHIFEWLPSMLVRASQPLPPGVEFDKPYSALHQASSHQAIGAEFGRNFVVHAVQLFGRFRFFRQVDRFGACRLHPEGELLRVDAGLEGYACRMGR